MLYVIFISTHRCLRRKEEEKGKSGNIKNVKPSVRKKHILNAAHLTIVQTPLQLNKSLTIVWEKHPSLLSFSLSFLFPIMKDVDPIAVRKPLS